MHSGLIMLKITVIRVVTISSLEFYGSHESALDELLRRNQTPKQWR